VPRTIPVSKYATLDHLEAREHLVSYIDQRPKTLVPTTASPESTIHNRWRRGGIKATSVVAASYWPAAFVASTRPARRHSGDQLTSAPIKHDGRR
jgi:hypothetical protein